MLGSQNGPWTFDWYLIIIVLYASMCLLGMECNWRIFWTFNHSWKSPMIVCCHYWSGLFISYQKHRIINEICVKKVALITACLKQVPSHWHHPYQSIPFSLMNEWWRQRTIPFIELTYYLKVFWLCWWRCSSIP